VEVDAGSASRAGQPAAATYGLASLLLVSAGLRVGAAPGRHVPSLRCDAGEERPRRGCELMGSSSSWLARSSGPEKRRGRRAGCSHGPASWRSDERSRSPGVKIRRHESQAREGWRRCWPAARCSDGHGKRIGCRGGLEIRLGAGPSAWDQRGWKFD
jgi:hypothetical protein